MIKNIIFAIKYIFLQKGSRLYMQRYDELNNLVKSFEQDFRKFYQRGNKTAGIRLRKDMQSLRKLAKDIRIEVQNFNKENELEQIDS